jgi:hypothetical protein
MQAASRVGGDAVTGPSLQTRPIDGSGVRSRVISAHITTPHEHTSSGSEPAFRARERAAPDVPICMRRTASAGVVMARRSVLNAQREYLPLHLCRVERPSAVLRLLFLCVHVRGRAMR